MAVTKITELTAMSPGAIVDTLGPLFFEVETRKPRSMLRIGGGLNIELLRPMPNRFHRWMQRVAFGFEWRAL